MGQTWGTDTWGTGGLSGKGTFMPRGQHGSGEDVGALDSGPHSEFHFRVEFVAVSSPACSVPGTSQSGRTEIRICCGRHEPITVNQNLRQKHSYCGARPNPPGRGRGRGLPSSGEVPSPRH